MMHCHRRAPWWNLFFSFSQSAPTVSVSRARETISRKKEEKVKLIFISASIGHSFELACLRGFFLQFCTTCSLLRSRRSTLEMCFLGLPGEHICLNIVFLMSCQTWVQIATNREEGSGKPQSAAGETGVTSCITFESIQRCISASWKELKKHWIHYGWSHKTLDSTHPRCRRSCWWSRSTRPTSRGSCWTPTPGSARFSTTLKMKTLSTGALLSLLPELKHRNIPLNTHVKFWYFHFGQCPFPMDTDRFYVVGSEECDQMHRHMRYLVGWSNIC